MPLDLLGLEPYLALAARQVQGEGGKRQPGNPPPEAVHDPQAGVNPRAEVHGALDGVAVEEVVWLDAVFQKRGEETAEDVRVVVDSLEEDALVDHADARTVEDVGCGRDLAGELRRMVEVACEPGGLAAVEERGKARRNPLGKHAGHPAPKAKYLD